MAKSRKWSERYLGMGFTSVFNDGNIRPQCVVCYTVQEYCRILENTQGFSALVQIKSKTHNQLNVDMRLAIINDMRLAISKTQSRISRLQICNSRNPINVFNVHLSKLKTSTEYAVVFGLVRTH